MDVQNWKAAMWDRRWWKQLRMELEYLVYDTFQFNTVLVVLKSLMGERECRELMNYAHIWKIRKITYLYTHNLLTSSPTFLPFRFDSGKIIQHTYICFGVNKLIVAAGPRFCRMILRYLVSHSVPSLAKLCDWTSFSMVPEQTHILVE